VALLTAVCFPATAQTLPGVGTPTHRNAATLQQMYEYAFRVQNKMDARAVTSVSPASAASGPGNWLATHLQLTPEQFLTFRSAAQRFAPTDRDLTRRARALAAADRSSRPGSHALSENTRFKIFELAAQRLAAAAQEEAALHRSLSAAQAAELDEKISTLFAEHLRKFSPASRAAAIGQTGAVGRPSGIRAADQAAAGANPGYANGGSACQNLTPDEEYDIEDGCEDDGDVYDLETCGCDPPPDGGGGGGDQDTTPSVTFSGPSSVAQGGTATFDVTTSNVSQSQPVQLTLTTLEGSGSAAFPGNQTSMSITGPGPILISGVSASSIADNIKLDGSAFFEGGNYSVATTGPLTFSVTPPPPSLTSSTTLWFFGSGNTPPTAFTQGGIKSVITASGASGGTFSWTITQGKSEVSFASGTQTSSITTTGNAVTIYSIGPSKEANDATLQLTWTPAGTSVASTASLNLSVDSPSALVSKGDPINRGVTGSCITPQAGDSGYQSLFPYAIKSVLGVYISNIGVNEVIGAKSVDYPGNNWPSISPMNVVNPGQFYDDLCAIGVVLNPPTFAPQPTLMTTKINHFPQHTWYVGSTTIGSGIQVQTDTLQYYEDHGVVEAVISPVPK